ncbi:MAG TPA: hypothetical protein VLT62_13140 [Candidatus Methylomirabilis sp.]|nr:hypothetical protein [Candidatus Methylomirabilis sp.]
MPTTIASPRVVRVPAAAVNRWWQMVAAVIAMMAIANLQYAWTLFTTPLTQSLGATLTIIALLQFIGRPVWFVVLSGLAFFSWGEIFSLFPSVTGDLFGRKYATTNYGIVYTAKGLASIFAGPVAALARHAAGSWVPVFWAMVVCSAVDAILALVLLKPLARRTVRTTQGLTGAGGRGRPAERPAHSLAGGSD